MRKEIRLRYQVSVEINSDNELQTLFIADAHNANKVLLVNENILALRDLLLEAYPVGHEHKYDPAQSQYCLICGK